MSISVLNTNANLSGKTLQAAENDDTVTGLKTFNRGAAPPFAVGASSTNVANLDADKVDGKHASDLAQLAAANAFTDATDSTSSTTGAIKTAGGLGVAKAANIGTTLGVGDLLTLTKGQIAFPATQVPSTGANVLDDYEEGTWTPVIGGSGGTSGQSYSNLAGVYVKIGQLVIASFDATLSAKGTITSSVQIQGLPFTCNASAGTVAALQFGNLATSWIYIHAALLVGTTAATLVGMTAAGTSMSVPTTTDISNTTRFTGTFIYRTNG